MAPEDVPEEWDFYPSHVDDRPASIFLNLWFRTRAPLEAAPVLYWVRIEMVEAGAHGMGTRVEAEELQEIEESITTRAQAVGLFYVSRLRSGGHWQLTFYGAEGQEPVLFGIAGQAVEGRSRRFELSSQTDDDWEYYVDFLYPDEERERWMDDRRLVEALGEHGDSLQTPRRVDHWSYFTTESGRTGFTTRAREQGFEVEPESGAGGEELAESRSEAEPRFEVRVFRTDSIELDHIHEVTTGLARLAKAHGGEYDGWETSVEADAAPA